MKRSCNLCGKKPLVMRHLLHGNDRYELCGKCKKGILELKSHTKYRHAKEYIEKRMHMSHDEKMEFFLRSRIRNFQSVEEFRREDNSEEENSIVALLQSTGILGGGVLFLLGICMMNIHLKFACLLIVFAVLMGMLFYGMGILVSFILFLIKRKQ